MKILTENSKIFITNLKSKDTGKIVEILANPNISKYLISLPFPYSESDAKFWLKKIKYYNRKVGRPLGLAIRHKDFGLIGSIGYSCKFSKDTHQEDIGYWLDEKFWGQGIMSNVLKSFVEYSFCKYSFKRIGAHIFSDNVGSKKVLENCGFQYEGTLRKLHLNKQTSEFVDALVYSTVHN